jgi:hypothetical protein
VVHLSFFIMLYSIKDLQFRISERHLRCIWFDPKLRPAELFTESGTSVCVEDPGRWNLEAGPDFLDAVIIEKDTGIRRQGNVELHLKPTDWNAHGHKGDPAYSNIIAHVCFTQGVLPCSNLPEGCIQLSLQRNLGQSFMSFDSLDLSAYPHASMSEPSPCMELIRKRGPKMTQELLVKAGEFRMGIKKAKMRSLADTVGLPQAFYEETMCALGYKQNKQQFRRLATAFRYDELRSMTTGSPEKCYAMMMGISGLLPSDIPAGCDPAAASFIRRLWNIWWKHNSIFSDISMTREDWTLAGIRPLNHPARRMAAAAGLFATDEELWRQVIAIDMSDPKSWTDNMCSLIAGKAVFPHFLRRISLTGKPAGPVTALIGKERINALISNVVIPFIGAYGKTANSLTSEVRAEHDNSDIRDAANNLFGHDHNPVLYRKDGIRQQGLIQIYHDFCLNNKNTCAECGLLKSLKK